MSNSVYFASPRQSGGRRRGPRLVRRDPRDSWRELAQDLEAAREIINSLSRSERQAWDQADALGAATRELIALLSHELRNPLQAMFGYAELLEAGVHGKLNDDQLLDVTRIQESQKELLETLNGMLRGVKMERLSRSEPA